MKKVIIIIAAVAVVIAGVFIIGSGFKKESSAYISSFSVSEDGTEMTINVAVGNSVGFIRDVKVHQQEGGKLYLDCYAAFGGFNGSIGAKSEYTISLAPETEIIALYRNDNAYQEVLKKDADGTWQMVK